MKDYLMEPEALVSESDVEQKVLYGLLTNPSPTGLEFDSTEVLTKIHLRKFTIDKGKKEHSYVPDYVISISGLPVMVVEAKKPDEDLEEALREAALYATSVNRLFQTDINPCRLVIASDGTRLLASSWDNEKPDFNIPVDEWTAVDAAFSLFRTKFSRSNLADFAEQTQRTIRPANKYFKPITFLGGKYVQGKTTTNEFGEKISIDYRHLFNPNEDAEKVDIVQNAYVTVKKQESRIDPIDKLIRKKLSVIADVGTEISDSSNPIPIIEKLHEAHNYNNHVLLLVGSVGAGKSTFATYLKEVALEKSLVQNLVWLTLDLNLAPVSKDDIYPWIKNKIIGQLRGFLEASGTNCDELDFLLDLFSVELEKERQGPLKLFAPDSDRYKEHLYETLVRLKVDLNIVLEAYINKVVVQAGKELIIVLDNCDKRKREDQMLMFEVANWMKDSIRAIIFLPLRDTTYDHFGREKPLDTVVKDLTFRITPPPLYNVLNARLQYAARLADQRRDGFYQLPNGIRVQYPAREEQTYLRCILTSLFQRPKFKRLVSGLSGGDIRVGLEIFLDFCKSGHISSTNIFRMRQSNGDYTLPDHVIARVCMRGDRVFYTDANARVKNLFQSDYGDPLPDPFVRISILGWLAKFAKKRGPSGVPGYHRVGDLITALESLGHARFRVKSELLQLLRFSLVVNESQDSLEVENDELVAITAPGIVHLEFADDIEYIATVSEDIWYTDQSTAQGIADNLAGNTAIRPYTIDAITEHAELAVNYLKGYFDENFSRYAGLVDDGIFLEVADFSSVEDRIESLRLGFGKRKFIQFEVGSECKGIFKRTIPGGYLVDIEDSGQWGFLPETDSNDATLRSKSVGSRLSIRIVRRDDTRERYLLGLTGEIDQGC